MVSTLASLPRVAPKDQPPRGRRPRGGKPRAGIRSGGARNETPQVMNVLFSGLYELAGQSMFSNGITTYCVVSYGS